MTFRSFRTSSPAPSAIFLPSSMTTTRSDRRMPMSSLCSIKRIVSPSALSSDISACISAVSVGFMPAVGSSSSNRRGLSASARDFDAAAIGVGEAIGRLVDPRQQTFAEAREDRPYLLAQPLLFGLDRRWPQQRQAELEQWPDQRHGWFDGL